MLIMNILYKNLLKLIIIILLSQISMEQQSPHQQAINKSDSIVKDKDSVSILSKVEPNQSNQMLLQYSQKLINFRQITAHKYLEQVLVSAMNKFKDISFNTIIDSNNSLTLVQQQIDEFQQSLSKILLNTQNIFIKKDREQEYDEGISILWRDYKRKYKTALAKVKVIKTLINNQTKPIYDISRLFRQKTRSCLPLVQIIKTKLTNLKIIHIYYSRKYQEDVDQFRYQISAFEFFKLIYENKQLSEVKVKGVLVQQFDKFISKMNQLTNNQTVKQQKQQLDWIKDIHPYQFLKLAIDAFIIIDTDNQEKCKRQLDDLRFFCRIFQQITNINVQIKIGFYDKISCWKNQFQEILVFLKTLKKIEIAISNSRKHITIQKGSDVRSLIFGGLSSFTEIKQLYIHCIQFEPYVGINDLLAMEQSLTTLFQNNSITHLKLNYNNHLPVFPIITTLHSIYVDYVTFRKEANFMREVVRNNPQLKSIKCRRIKQQCIINEQLFNQLQVLNLCVCSGITLGQMSPKSPSNIKFLSLINTPSIVIIADILSVMFPKLVNLEYLQLSEFDFGHQLICTIPSPHLERLGIDRNKIITDQELELIDLKWPNLKHLTLSFCENVTKDFWNVCKFKGLTRLQLNKYFYDKYKKDLKHLQRIRGIDTFYA